MSTTEWNSPVTHFAKAWLILSPCLIWGICLIVDLMQIDDALRGLPRPQAPESYL